MIKDDGDFYLIELSKQEPGQTIYSCVHFLHIVENDDNTVSYFDDGIEIQRKLVFSGTAEDQFSLNFKLKPKRLKTMFSTALRKLRRITQLKHS